MNLRERRGSFLSWLWLVLLFPSVPSLVGCDGPVAAPLASVELDLSDRVPMVPVYLNGRGPFRFVIDTASAETVLNQDVARDLGLAALGRSWVGKPGEPLSAEGDLVRIEKVRVGELELRDVQAVSLDLSELMGDDDTRDGSLGYPFFSGYLWTLDYADQRLVVETGELPPADGGRILSYTLDDGKSPTISIEVADRKMTAHLDSARFGGVALHSDLMETLPLTSRPGMIGMIRNVEGEFVLYGGTLDGGVRFGDQVLERPRLLFTDAQDHANLGASALDRFALTFDPANQRVRFQGKESRAGRRLHEKAAAVGTVSGEGADLKTAFNRELDKVRMVLILSPT